MLSDKTKARIRALIYPIQFEANPIDGIDRVINKVVNESALNATQQEYLDSIQEALSSNAQLSNLIPQRHSEDAIRHFLAEVKHRLQHPG